MCRGGLAYTLGKGVEDGLCFTFLLFALGWIVEHFAANNLGWWTQEARDGIGQGRFATAAFTGKAENLAAPQFKADIGDGVDSATGGIVIDADMPGFEE